MTLDTSIIATTAKPFVSKIMENIITPILLVMAPIAGEKLNKPSMISQMEAKEMAVKRFLKLVLEIFLEIK